MAKELRHIPYEELASDLAGVLDHVRRERESVVIAREGVVIAVLRPPHLSAFVRQRSADEEAFRSAAGGWR